MFLYHVWSFKDAVAGISKLDNPWKGVWFRFMLSLAVKFLLLVADPRESETVRPLDLHHSMEVRLGLSKGPVCPSFIWFHLTTSMYHRRNVTAEWCFMDFILFKSRIDNIIWCVDLPHADLFCRQLSQVSINVFGIMNTFNVYISAVLNLLPFVIFFPFDLHMLTKHPILVGDISPSGFQSMLKMDGKFLTQLRKKKCCVSGFLSFVFSRVSASFYLLFPGATGVYCLPRVLS